MSRAERIEELKREIRDRIPKSGEAFRRAEVVYPHGEISAVRGFNQYG